MSSVFVDKNLKYVVAVYANSSASRRIEYWLQHTLHEGLFSLSPSLWVPRTWLSSYGDWTFLVTAVWIWNSFSGRSNLRSAECHDMFVPSTRTQLGRRSFHVAAPAVWNAFPSRLRSSSISRGQFRAGLKTHLFTQVYRHLLELPLKSVLFYIYIYGSGTVFHSISLPIFCCHWKTYFFELCYP